MIIEDQRDLAYGVRTYFETEGYVAEVATDGHAGLEAARAGRPDLIVLDLGLPDLDGVSVLRQLRHEGNSVPIIILTARGQTKDKLVGFDSGADDYVTKPFSMFELGRRVHAQLRRKPQLRRDEEATPVEYAIGSLRVKRATREVECDGLAVHLTPLEFRLLWALATRAGAIVPRDELLTEVWGYRKGVYSRTVDTHIKKLRAKLGDDAHHPRLILTVWKGGYRLALPPLAVEVVGSGNASPPGSRPPGGSQPPAYD